MIEMMLSKKTVKNSKIKTKNAEILSEDPQEDKT